MDYCKICPECGARLDPGEICDCQRDLQGERYIRRENHLVERVAQARKLGMSYGQYMAMLKDGLIEDPLMRDEDE